jgi:hypothetical protein
MDKCLLLDMELNKSKKENTTSFKAHGELNGENKDTSESLLMKKGHHQERAMSKKIHITQ